VQLEDLVSAEAREMADNERNRNAGQTWNWKTMRLGDTASTPSRWGCAGNASEVEQMSPATNVTTGEADTSVRNSMQQLNDCSSGHIQRIKC